MRGKRQVQRTVRWILAVVVLASGSGAAWAWGRAAGQSEPVAAVERQPAAAMLYGAWQPAAGARTVLYRSADQGETWQPVPVRTGIASVTAWASDGADRVAVALSDGSMFRSGNRGERWSSIASTLPVVSLAFGGDGRLFAGTDGQGIWMQAGSDDPEPLTEARTDLADASVRFFAVAGGRLIAATSEALFLSDDAGQTFTAARAVPGRISALVALDAENLFVGTEGSGILRSRDAGLSWQPAVAGLGEAAGMSLSITALRADASEANVLYAAVSYLVGGTRLHESAAGSFVTLDGGATWLKLAGPAFPAAQRASDLVLIPSRPLTALAATPEGLQAYQPDVPAALRLIDTGNVSERSSAARMLGLVRAQGAGEALLAALADPDSAVAQAAAGALGRLDDEATVPALEAALSGTDLQVRRHAARALGLMGAESAVQPLSVLLMEGEKSTAGAAAEALGQIGSPSAVASLVATLADRELTVQRHAALGALEALGESAVEPLVSLLSTGDAPARRNAAEALGWIGSASATGALLEALGDDSEGLRSQAAWALGEIADPVAQRALVRVRSSDPSASVREAADLALRRLAERPAGRAGAWSALLFALGGPEVVRWMLLGLSFAVAGLLVASNLRPSAVRVARREGRR